MKSFLLTCLRSKKCHCKWLLPLYQYFNKSPLHHEYEHAIIIGKFWARLNKWPVDKLVCIKIFEDSFRLSIEVKLFANFISLLILEKIFFSLQPNCLACNLTNKFWFMLFFLIISKKFIRFPKYLFIEYTPAEESILKTYGWRTLTSR